MNYFNVICESDLANFKNKKVLASKNILLIKSFDIYFLEVLAKLILMLSETRSLRVIDSLSLYHLDDETSKLT